MSMARNSHVDKMRRSVSTIMVEPRQNGGRKMEDVFRSEKRERGADSWKSVWQSQRLQARGMYDSRPSDALAARQKSRRPAIFVRRNLQKCGIFVANLNVLEIRIFLC